MGVGTHDDKRIVQMITQYAYNLMDNGRRGRLTKEETDVHAPQYA